MSYITIVKINKTFGSIYNHTSLIQMLPHQIRYFLRFGRVDERNGRPDGCRVPVKFRFQYQKHAPTGHGYVIGTNAHMRLHRQYMLMRLPIRFLV